MALFVVWENRTEHPMVPMRMFRNRAFTAINLAGALMSVGMFGAIFLMTQFLQNIQGYTAMQAAYGCWPGPPCRWSSRPSAAWSPTASAANPWSPSASP